MKICKDDKVLGIGDQYWSDCQFRTDGICAGYATSIDTYTAMPIISNLATQQPCWGWNCKPNLGLKKDSTDGNKCKCGIGATFSNAAGACQCGPGGIYSTTALSCSCNATGATYVNAGTTGSCVCDDKTATFDEQKNQCLCKTKPGQYLDSTTLKCTDCPLASGASSTSSMSNDKTFAVSNAADGNIERCYVSDPNFLFLDESGWWQPKSGSGNCYWTSGGAPAAIYTKGCTKQYIACLSGKQLQTDKCVDCTPGTYCEPGKNPQPCAPGWFCPANSVTKYGCTGAYCTLGGNVADPGNNRCPAGATTAGGAASPDKCFIAKTMNFKDSTGKTFVFPMQINFPFDTINY